MDPKEIAQMIDISAVKTNSTYEAVSDIIDAAKEYGFICVFPNPCFLDETIEALKETPAILVGGVVGFPSGAETTTAKVFQAKENVAKGCDEIDMVMNIGLLKSERYEEVRKDIDAVCEAVSPLPLKVIIETPLLSDEEIAKATQIIGQTGAQFVKTGTGWSGNTTLDHVKIIGDNIREGLEIKVAGGVRSLEVLLLMRALGVTRFGIGKDSAIQIMESAQKKLSYEEASSNSL